MVMDSDIPLTYILTISYSICRGYFVSLQIVNPKLTSAPTEGIRTFHILSVLFFTLQAEILTSFVD